MPAGDIFDTRVSFDGTWMKRGLLSHIGLQAAKLFDVGCVIDMNIFCTECRICNKKMTAPTKKASRIKHKNALTQKYADELFEVENAMESQGGHVIFGRSIEKLNEVQFLTS